MRRDEMKGYRRVNSRRAREKEGEEKEEDRVDRLSGDIERHESDLI